MPNAAVILLLLGASLVALLLVFFARREAQAIRDAAREEVEAQREDARAMMVEAQRREERVSQREKDISADQRAHQQYARQLDERVAVVSRDERRLADERASLEKELTRRISEVAGLSAEEARAELVTRLRADAESDAVIERRRLERAMHKELDAKARELIVEAMQRQVGSTTAQAAVTWIDLPSEEMKGRIIGREGRNIRAFEALTGVNVIVEEGVDAVQLSSFDVERREIAEVTLRALVEDGRIQPHRVELEYAKAVGGAHQRHIDAGLDAITAVGIRGVDQEIIEILGRLRLRSSYGQNVLAHLVESAMVAAALAELVGADVDVARRAAFFHDLGKAFTGEREGTHAAIGAELARAHGEEEPVVHAIAAHHDEVPPETVEAVIVQLADAVSASRPGARREDLDGYLERMESLEKFVAEHTGVTRALAMSAGREVRVVVEPTEVDDAGAQDLARTIAEHISKEFNVPGEIKVTVIRELRAEAVAH
ncbi:MAG: ribonuclease Y [Demequina sp.]|nr:ribonuclease Y [Demequina sp.]